MKRNRKEEREYRKKVELVLGKKIPKNVHVHHVDGNRLNNSNDNLVVCEDRAYHFLLHTRDRALRSSGDVNKRKCLMCGEYDSTDNMSPKMQSGCKEPNYYHPECSRKKYDPIKRRSAYLKKKSNSQQGRMTWPI